MKKLLHYILYGDPTENPWDWFLKVIAIPYLAAGFFVMLFVWPLFRKLGWM